MTMRANEIASGAPTWVYVLLVALIALGVRRLRTREMPVIVALIPPAAFLIWSIVGAHAFADRAGGGMAASAWLAGAVVGALSGVWMPEPRGERLSGGRVRQPGSWLPLFLYLGVFVIRFACGAWAAVVPQQALRRLWG
jgi:membrane associated rhomboid family serine protease